MAPPVIVPLHILGRRMVATAGGAGARVRDTFSMDAPVRRRLHVAIVCEYLEARAFADETDDGRVSCECSRACGGMGDRFMRKAALNFTVPSPYAPDRTIFLVHRPRRNTSPLRPGSVNAQHSSWLAPARRFSLGSRGGSVLRVLLFILPCCLSCLYSSLLGTPPFAMHGELVHVLR